MPITYRNPVQSLITGQAVPGNAGVAIMARIRAASGALLTQASVSSITYSVYNIQAEKDGSGNPTQMLGSTSQTVTAVVFDSLQQDGNLWTKDSAANPGPDGASGWNYRFVVPAAYFTVANSGDWHRVNVVITPASGQLFRLIFEFPTLTIDL